MTQLIKDLEYALNPANALSVDNNQSGKRYNVKFGVTVLNYQFDYVLGNATFVGTAEDSGYHFKIYIVKGHGIQVSSNKEYSLADPTSSVLLIPCEIENIRQVYSQLVVGLTVGVAINEAQKL